MTKRFVSIEKLKKYCKENKINICCTCKEYNRCSRDFDCKDGISVKNLLLAVKKGSEVK